MIKNTFIDTLKCYSQININTGVYESDIHTFILSFCHFAFAIYQFSILGKYYAYSIFLPNNLLILKAIYK